MGLGWGQGEGAWKGIKEARVPAGLMVASWTLGLAWTEPSPGSFRNPLLEFWGLYLGGRWSSLSETCGFPVKEGGGPC